MLALSRRRTSSLQIHDRPPRCVRLRRSSFRPRRVLQRRRLARVAGPGAHRRLDRNRPARVVVARGREPGLARARTAAVRHRSSSATACTCRHTPAPHRRDGGTCRSALMCFNADTGKLLWEHKYNLFTSDVPPHRIAWASPAVDPATGNVFAISGNGLLMSLSKDGKLLWERSLAEEFGMWTTHGGRMSSPIIDGDQVIVSGLTFSWGEHAGGAHRFLSFDKTTGQAHLGQRARRAADRHDLREPVHRDVERHADVLLRRQRRRDARAEGVDRRTGVELAGQPARPEHRRAGGRAGRHRHATARRTSARARWACSRRCRRRRRAR